MSNSVKTLCEAIWALESKFDLTNQRRLNIPFWNMVRMNVYYALAKRLGIFGEPHPYKSDLKWKLSFLIGVLIGLIRNLTKFYDLSTADTIIFESTRTKEISKGLFTDVYSHYYAFDEIKKNKRVLVFSRTKNGFIEKNDNLKRFNIDSIELLRNFAGIVFSRIGLFTPSITKDLVKNMNEAFNVDCTKQLIPLLRKGVINYLVTYCVYRFIFFFTFRVKEIVLVDGYSFRSGVIAAAKDAGIKVFELQHGVITKYHLGYSFPKHTPNIRFIPDKLFVWPGPWKEIVLRISPVQLDIYPHKYLEDKILDYANIKRQDNKVVIVSQSVISQQLADKILLNIDKFMAYRVFYKLHPSEYEVWQENKALVEIIKHKNFELIKDCDLYALFAKCKYHIGVFSTALFEGISFGCELVLVDLPGSEYMSHINKKVYLHDFI
jgi:hypothetical protein